MKRLLLLRHAKAVPGDDKTDDFGRALNPRGRTDAPRLAAMMHIRGYMPDLILCSTALRTVETWNLAAAEFDTSPPVEFLKPLYLASPRTILKHVHAAGDDTGTLLAIGHNPGLEDCAIALARKSSEPDERARLDQMRGKFPTCALAVLDFDVAHWRDTAPGEGALTDFIRPKDWKDE